MKKITNQRGEVFGPFVEVVEQSDGYMCDGCLFPFSVTDVCDVGDWVGALPAVTAAPPVPASITMRQARLALLGAGLLGNVDAAINALPEPQKSAVKITWEYSQEVQRHNSFVSQLAPVLGLTEAQTDALFVSGAKL